jgi:glycosyltransferase involved in cell wall biosynthesis
MVSWENMLQLILYVLYTVLLGVFGLGAWRLRYAFTHFKMKPLITTKATIDDLPSVSVCIPARNEQHAMSDSLQQVIGSTYPKLEIIVLDDASGDNTTSLIKAFARDGVRFVQGAPLAKGWIGKNHSLQGLLKEASGTYILYMDIDTRLSPDSIEQLVAYAQQEEAAMVSVLPRREDGARGSVLFSTLRYFWAIMFHRKGAPATASSAWLIHRQTLLDRWGGFESFKDTIQPEARLSAELMASNKYRFLIGTELLGISYEKKWRSQLATSVRLLFPMLRFEIPSAVIAALDLLILASPLLIVMSLFIVGPNINHLFAGILLLLLSGLYAVYLRKVWKRGWIVGGLLWSVTALQEAILVILSAVLYKQNKVTWKGRLVKNPR